MRRTSYDCAPNTSEKQLANHPRRVKRNESLTPIKSVPKKKKPIEAERDGGGPPEAGALPAEMKIKKTPATRRTSTAKTNAAAPRKSATAAKTKAAVPTKPGQGTEPSDETIRLRAYFISERRRRFALPGDAESDWLEAKRQLLFEAGPR
jgi:hypothetical protein